MKKIKPSYADAQTQTLVDAATQTDFVIPEPIIPAVIPNQFVPSVQTQAMRSSEQTKIGKERS